MRMRATKQRLVKIQAGLLAASGFAASALTHGAGPALPVPCAPGTCGATGASQFVTAGAATAVATQNALKINQTSNSAILNWSSFNIGANGSVVFNQPGSSSVALNRIFQSSPSQIFGNLSANGQVYLINQNGFIFGKTAVVNVGSLLASSLPITLSDADFGKGILSKIANDLPIFDATNCPTCDPLAQVVVQPGAQLTAADQGRLLLAGQTVINGGSLTAPDGQVILAAGARVYLQADADPSLRGLVVEVDQGGTAWNQLSGSLSSPRGNVTMTGLMVNQDGRISATTSVSSNGSIRLEAADTAVFTGKVVASSHGGTLTIGPQSQMSILPETSSSATEVPAQTQLQSSVTLLGEQVILQGGSIVAPNGNLTAIAAADPSPAAADPAGGLSSNNDANARLHIDAGTNIDLSGSTATLPVSANLVAVQLRSSELADDPTQRNGALHGLTVYVDARNQPSTALADVSGDVAAVAQNVAQRTENGGNAVFQSTGDLVFAKGASLNVSGGSTSYIGGVMQTSYLVGADGRLYPIATANPLMTYVGVLNPTLSQTFNNWGVQQVLPTQGLSAYQPGYLQGAQAGSIQFAAPAMVLQGALQGTAINGPYQRSPSTAVPGGRLIIGLPGGVGASATTQNIDYLSPDVLVTNTPVPTVVADDASLPAGLTLDLPVGYLTSSGFTSTQIFGNYGVTFASGTPLNLPAGSTLSVNAARVDVLSNITDSGGTLSFQNVGTLGNATALGTLGNSTSPADRSGVYVANGVDLDVRGLWTNDDFPLTLTQPQGQTLQAGGNITLGTASPGALLSIADNVTLQVSGGAWLNNRGVLAPGAGGSITINDSSVATGAQAAGGVHLGNNVQIDGFGVEGAAGGTLNFTAPRIEISNGSGTWATGQNVDDVVAPGDVFQLHSSLFSNYGFETINVSASGLVAPGAFTSTLFTVDPGTAIDATVLALNLNSRASLMASASSVDGIARVALPAQYLRPAAALSFSAVPPKNSTNTAGNGATSAGDLSIGAGASITTEAGGSITLTSLGSIFVDGALTAPGGTVEMHIVTPSTVSGTYEAGFLPNQRIELGATGSVDVAGTFVSQPSSANLDLGKQYTGGTVNLFADRGAVITDVGSSISIAGTDATLDVAQATGGYRREIAASAGGTISVRSGEAISLMGGIAAAAGAPGTAGPAPAGALDIALTRADSTWWNVTSLDDFSSYPLTVEILPSIAGVSASAASSNQAVLGNAQLLQSGLDSLSIVSGSNIELSGTFSLALARQITLDAPVFSITGGANATLSAPYVAVGFNHPVANNNTATGGSGAVTFGGAEIDLVGSSVFQGTSNVSFLSSGDMVLRGESVGTGLNTLSGALTVAGSLNLSADRIYPVTATSFAITAQSANGAPGTVAIGQSTANPGTPYSAGGALSITADNVTSTGTLYAPFGTIALNANDTLTLGDGSLTSVSGGGLAIPYGETLFGGQQWIYGGLSGVPISGVPSRSVSLTAPSVTLTKQATIDLSGGGDLTAFEWVPGSGGTQDALAPGYATSVNANLYAILPSTRGQAAPQDPQNSDPSIGAGTSVYLSGVAGLTAGYYPLLPARYALVPGALLIEAEPKYQSIGSGLLGALPDGTPIVAGYFSFGSTGLHETPGYTGFAVYPGSYGGQLAQYGISAASTFFSAEASAAGAPRPTLPADAGTLSIAVSGSLDVAGQVRTAAAGGGLAAPIEITANDLVVGSPTGPVPADAVSIAGSVIEGWKPGSLLLGGTLNADGKSIDVLANSVTVGSGTTLTAGQIVLVAGQSIDVQNGATLQTTSASGGTAPATAPPMQSVTLTGPGGATAGLLAVSDVNWVIPVRTAGATATGAATVTVESGATIGSRGSLTLDAAGGVTLNGATQGTGAEWSLGSSSIAFVPAGVQADALSIGPSLLTQLAGASAVRLASTGSIDLMTPVTLGVGADGAPALGSLILAASSINNLTGDNATAGATQSQFAARTIVLQGSGAVAPSTVSGPAGSSVSFTAGTLDLGLVVGPNAAPSISGPLSISGFASTNATVSGAVVGQGSGGLSTGGDLSITTAGVTAATAANTTISAGGVLSIAPAAAGSTGVLPQLLGGELSLSGASVDISGVVAALSGILTVTASQGDLTIAPGARLSTAGAMVNIGNQSAGTPGGSIQLSAANNLILAPGAIVDVSAAGTAAGGALTLSAGGSASLGSTLNGSGGAGAMGGSFALDAVSLAAVNGSAANPLDALASALGTGGFNDAINLRVRTGGLTLDAGNQLSANTVSLTADSGNVLIGGTISANSASLRSSLSIFGGAGVEIAAGAALHADGTGAAGVGGTIEIGTGELLAGQTGALDHYNGATISLDSGSTISAAGAAGSGTLLLRAPALIASNDVAITSLAADTSQVGQVIIEPVLVFNTQGFSNASAPTSSDFSTVYGAVGTYMAAAAPGIATRLATGSSPPTLVEAGVELVASGNLVLQSADNVSPALDLSAAGSNWRFNNAPVDLTIRAAGNIEVANTLTDGFENVTVGGSSQLALLPGMSSSFRLVAGADLTSANPLAVVAGRDASLTIDAGAVVRTGTGDIDLVAARDIVIGGAGAGAYTAGIPAIAPGGSIANPYPNLPAKLGQSATDGSGNVVGEFVPNSGGLLISFPTGGGSLVVSAGRDIIGASLSDPSVTTWQAREGGGQLVVPGSKTPLTILPQWGVNLSAYDWNFGTLGGGDLRISAGRDANNITAAAADSLLPQYGGTRYVISGGLSITTGRDLGGSEVFLADGSGTVAAGGALTAIQSTVPGSGTIGEGFFLQSSLVNVSARLGIALDGVFDPTALTQLNIAKPLVNSFFSYSDTSALNLESTAGDILVGVSSNANPALLGISQNNAGGLGSSVLPANLSLEALGGNITFGGFIGGNGAATLFPSATGQLDLLAARDINGGNLTMSDAAPGSYATVASPLGLIAVAVGSASAAQFTGDIHGADTAPALITAGGSISQLSLAVPKATTVIAGEDIIDLSYQGQNLNATDQTLFSAGRDFSYSQSYGGSGVSVGGPGALEILAGRNLTLGFSPGVVTTGNLLNANLPTARGADLTMISGLGTSPDYAGFVNKIITPSSSYQAELIAYVESLQGSSDLSFAQAQTVFQSLTPARQQPLIDQVFFNELSLSGLAANSVAGAGFTEGYAAIDALFPGSRSGTPGALAGAYAGDLTLDFSRIYTLSGGNIDLVAPGGRIDVGLANAPARLNNRAASTLGIVAEGPGDVSIYTKGDVNVNSSRIFTLGGGNILIWSDEGSIDAGRGAKTAVSAPPPSVLINSDGTVTLDFSGAAAGSGIRTIQTNPDLALGNVDLVAPVGTVNAGDAGIGAAGNINIAARAVLGVGNINFGGTASGVPAAVNGLGAALSGASSAASGATNAATSSVESASAAEKETAAPLAASALSWLDVFVTGLGEENCKPDDIDCLKRQKTAVR
jgi:filamentous hemagglutinin